MRNKSSNSSSTSDKKQQAARLCGAKVRDLEEFEMIDPFNRENQVVGYINKKEGPEGGSIIISQINDKILDKLQLIHGTPKLHYPYKDYENYTWKEFEAKKARNEDRFKRYVIANKWNGSNILFFVYSDNEGNEFVSAKTKNRAFLSNNRHTPLLDLTLEALGMVKSENEDDLVGRSGRFIDDEGVWSKFPFLSFWIRSKLKEWQSISCELCGQGEPHLVKYDFHLQLAPLFIQQFNGSIYPIQIFAKEMNQEEEINKDCILGDVSNLEDLHNKLKQLQQEDFEKNEKYRAENGLKQRYEYNHFITEGKVFYTLNQDGRLLHRSSMYKLKPKDIEEVHWATFEKDIKGRVNEALRKCCERDKAITVESVRSEMDMREKEWSKFGSKVTYYVECVIKPEGLENSPPDLRAVFILCGSAKDKSQFAQQLQDRFDALKTTEEKTKNVNDQSSHFLETVNRGQNQPENKCIERVRIVLQRRNSPIYIDDSSNAEKIRKQVVAEAKGEGVRSDRIFIISFPISDQQEKPTNKLEEPDEKNYEEQVISSDDKDSHALIGELIEILRGEKLTLERQGLKRSREDVNGAESGPDSIKRKRED